MFVALDAIARESELIEDSGPSVRPRWITRGGRALRDPSLNPFLRWETMPHVQIRLWRLRDVVLDATTMVLLHGDRIVEGTKYVTPPETLATLRVDAARLVALPSEMPFVVCGDSWSNNHFHFLVHTLPTIAAACDTAGKTGIALLHQPFLPPHFRALELLGLHELRRMAVEPGRQYAIPDAIFCNFSVGAADFASSGFIAGLHGRLRDRITTRSVAKRVLYVSRRNTRHRIMRGEAAFIDDLRRRGITILDPAGVTLDEQIAAFRQAALVIGPHGAGMANVTFCPDEAEVYQLLPRIFDEPSVMVLAMRRGLAYWADAFDAAEGDDAPSFLRAWHLDRRRALDRVEELLPRTPVRRLAAAALRRLSRLR